MVLGTAALEPGCRRARGNAVNVIGSTSIQPFAEMLSLEFNSMQKDLYVEVQGGGSTAGLESTRKRMADIGMCSRALKNSETEFVPIEIALDGLAVVVHRSNNSVSNLTRQQICDIFAGRKTRWSDFGGPDMPIHVITREEGSGTREAFQKMVMRDERIFRRAVTQESNGAVKELVRNDPAAIGYMSLGLVGPDLKVVQVDGVMPSTATVRNHTYPLVRPFLFVLLKGAPENKAAAEFIKFVLSPKGQAMLEKEGLVGVREAGK